MKIVKFEDGTYAVRRGWFTYEYLDDGWYLQYALTWWPVTCPQMYKVATYAQAEKNMLTYKNRYGTDCGKPASKPLEIG